jgi:hypothetical protein
MALTNAPANLAFRGRERFWYPYLSELETIRSCSITLEVPFSSAYTLTSTDLYAEYDLMATRVSSLGDTRVDTSGNIRITSSSGGNCYFKDATVPSTRFLRIRPGNIITTSGFDAAVLNDDFTVVWSDPNTGTVLVEDVAGFVSEHLNEVTISKANTMPWVSGLTVSKIEEAPVAADPVSNDELALTVPDVIPSLVVTTVVYILADADGICTISNGSPCIVSIGSHGLADDQEILFQTSETLPAPLVAGTHYFVAAIDAGTFNISATAPGANINTTNAGSGTHKVLGKV